MRILPAISLAALLLGGCIPRTEAPAPPPVPRPAPPPPPAPAPPPPSSDWRDWPITPGTWTYRNEPSGSIASFGPSGTAPVLTLRCNRAASTVLLSRVGSTGTGMTIRTSTLTRAVPAQGGVATLGARDPLLDAIGFSRGRFVVESTPLSPAAVPAWAEILRVVEDCRG